MKYPCPCCGYYTYEHVPDGSYDICHVCFWEDDPIQLEDPQCEGGANRVSLEQARLNYKKSVLVRKRCYHMLGNPILLKCNNKF